MGAVLIVAIPVILLIVIMGIVKEGIRFVFPNFGKLLLVLVIAGWIGSLYALMSDSPGMGAFEKSIGIVVGTAVYWFVIGTIKLLILPVEMMGECFRIAKQKPEEDA